MVSKFYDYCYDVTCLRIYETREHSYMEIPFKKLRFNYKHKYGKNKYIY